jgi:CMP-N,N'-diacetyllegionaminic acid synthase
VYGQTRLLAVVPARGGSKGVPLKNIHPLAGRPLLAYTADVVHAAGIIDRAVVSTDHAAIAQVAQQCGLAVPFMRPARLAGDRVGDVDVLVHALQTVERIEGMSYDVVLMLQPTSPLRRVDHVLAVVERLVHGGWDAVWTVSPTPLKYHPLKQLVTSADDRLALFDSRGAAIVARQQLEPVYHRNGAVYAVTRRALLESGTLLPERTAALVLHEHLVSIDTLDDFADVERALAAERGGVICE